MGSLLFKKDKFSIPEAHVEKNSKSFFFMMYQIEN